MTMKNIVRPLALAAILGTLALPASAQWGPEEEKNCFLNGKKGTPHALRPDQRRPGRLLEARAVRGDSRRASSSPAPPTPGATRSTSSTRRPSISATTTSSSAVSFGKKGGFLLDLSWDQNPNWQSNTARTPYTETSPGVLHVPDSMRLALQNVYVPWVPPTASEPGRHRHGSGQPDRPGLLRGRGLRQPGPAHVRPALRAQDRPGRLRGPGGREPGAERQLLPRDARRQQEHDLLRRPRLRGRDPDRLHDRQLPLRRRLREGPLLPVGASVDFSQFTNDVPFVEIDNPERLQMNNPTNGRAVINDAEFFRLAMYPDNEAWQADFTGGITLPKRHKLTASLSTGNMSMDTALQNISTNPNLQTSATAPNPLFTVVPPYGSVAGRVRHVHGPGEVHRRPGQLARLHRVLAQVRARRQDRGLPLHEHGPRRRGRLRTATRASPASTRAGASSRSAARST